MRFRLSGLGFRVIGLQALVFRASGFGVYPIWGLCRALGDFRVEGVEIGSPVSGPWLASVLFKSERVDNGRCTFIRQLYQDIQYTRLDYIPDILLI